jgi:hypothetical protein
MESRNTLKLQKRLTEAFNFVLFIIISEKKKSLFSCWVQDAFLALIFLCEEQQN